MPNLHIVALSAPPLMTPGATVMSEFTADNVARIVHASNLREQVQDAKLVLNGESNQLTMMLHIALKCGVPANFIELVDCNPRPNGNTRTQLQKMEKDLRFPQDGYYVFVTVSWHMPRVIATARKQLKRLANHMVVGVPYADFHDFDWNEKVADEMWRIPQYINKGDIADPTIGME